MSSLLERVTMHIIILPEKHSRELFVCIISRAWKESIMNNFSELFNENKDALKVILCEKMIFAKGWKLLRFSKIFFKPLLTVIEKLIRNFRNLKYQHFKSQN